MLAVVFLIAILVILFACAELAYRIARLASRPPRWHALVLLTGVALCLAELVHLVHSMV